MQSEFQHLLFSSCVLLILDINISGFAESYVILAGISLLLHISCCVSFSTANINFTKAGKTCPVTSKTAYQVDKVLVADFSICVSISEGQQDFQFVGVELRTMSGQKIPEALRADEARIVRIILPINMDS